jgi:hypothetical protein
VARFAPSSRILAGASYGNRRIAPLLGLRRESLRPQTFVWDADVSHPSVDYETGLALALYSR